MTRAGLLAAGGLVLLTACSHHAPSASCTKPPKPAGCADLEFRGLSYDELRSVKGPRPEQLQELGDANYPACNDDPCAKGDLGGLGATDTWLIDGVDFHDALLGFRSGTSTYVVYVRVGVDPKTLAIPDRIG